MPEKEQKETKWESTLKQLEKDFGKGSLMGAREKPAHIEAISTGSLGLDTALGIRGLPKGRIVEIIGPESCIDGDSFIQYEVRDVIGNRKNHKGGRIKDLYKRFNKTGEYKIKRISPNYGEDHTFYLSSVNEYDRIIQNEIVAVLNTGKKNCFTITTEKGYQITATEDHKFYTGSSYIPLKDLQEGSIIMIHNNTNYKGRKECKNNRKYLFVKNHKVAGEKVIEGKYIYKRLLYSIAVIEAELNNLTIEKYIERLNGDYIEDLKFLGKEFHVHHIDENFNNNDLSNLAILSASDHGRLHAIERHNNLRFICIQDKVKTIEEIGERETYDIKMKSPYNNFVANKFVVHNSGKTTMIMHLIAEGQKISPTRKFAIIDAEHALDLEYAEALGVDLDRLHISQPDYGEQALEIAKRLIDTGEMDIVAIDSVAALVPKSELEGEVGDASVGKQARMMSQAMRMLAGKAEKNGTILMFTNQIREKIGVMWGSPEVGSGGNALKFYASVRLDIRKVTINKDGEEAISNRVRVKVTKNKVSPPFRQAEFNIVYGKGIDKFNEIIELGVECGVINKSGSWYSYRGNTIGQGLESVITLLSDNPELYEEIKTETIEKISC